jgi:hypothetical protein
LKGRAATLARAACQCQWQPEAPSHAVSLTDVWQAQPEARQADGRAASRPGTNLQGPPGRARAGPGSGRPGVAITVQVLLVTQVPGTVTVTRTVEQPEARRWPGPSAGAAGTDTPAVRLRRARQPELAAQ